MRSLLSSKVKGYLVRKMAKEIVVGDIILFDSRAFNIKDVRVSEHGVDVSSYESNDIRLVKDTILYCIQKEDPTIVISIEEKLEVLRKHEGISSVNSDHSILKDGDTLMTYDEWVKCGRPHKWSIIETDDEYEYWEDITHEGKVVWRGNKIIAWSNTKKKSMNMYMLVGKDGTYVFDKETYNLPKYIWR